MAEDVRNTGIGAFQTLTRVGLDQMIIPQQTKKCINDAADVTTFLCSKAFVDIIVFLGQLNRAMFPWIDTNNDSRVLSWPTQSPQIVFSPQVTRMKVLVQTLDTILKETPPDPGPRRFGNIAFRKWYKKVEERMPVLLQQALPENIWRHVTVEDRDLLKQELGGYLLGSFGSPERLDYGTGHELSFLVFLGGIWKVNGFAPSVNWAEERGVVVGVIAPYLDLVRDLVKGYSLEPAGSHGVWGLDDHTFIPYILGSAQYCPGLTTDAQEIRGEGSAPLAPNVSVVSVERTVRSLASANLYFGAVAFIYDVKKGPFWEHSPTLYDISGIQSGWAKINKGLVKMYHAEVLAKFPVVQHLQFGSLFKWETDLRAQSVPRPMPVSQSGLGAPPKGSNYTPSTASGISPGTVGIAPWAGSGITIQGARAPPSTDIRSSVNDQNPILPTR